MTDVRSVTVPPAVASAVTDGAGARSSAQSAKPFCDEDPGLPLPPPPLGGEAASRHDSKDESNNDSPGGVPVDDRPVAV